MSLPEIYTQIENIIFIISQKTKNNLDVTVEETELAYLEQIRETMDAVY